MSPPLLAISALLVIVLILAKVPMVWPIGNWADLPNLLAITAEDTGLILLALGFSTFIDRRLNQRLRAQDRFRLALRCGAVIVAIYAVVNISIYGALKQPLNSRVLAMMKHVGDLSSSCAEYCDWKLFCSLALAPAFVWWGSRRLEAPAARGSFSRWFLVLSGLWLVMGLGCLGSSTPDAWQRRAGRNAHREILYSLAVDFFTDRRVNVVGPFPEKHLEDFQPASVRPTEPLGAGPRNVIVFVLESTSAQYLSLYGASYDTTPNLCAEAGNALIFERAYAHVGYTFCSFMTLAFSVYPGLPWQYRPGGARPMPKGLGNLLEERGYRTAFFAAANPEWGGMDIMAKAAGLNRVYGPLTLSPDHQSTSWGCEDGPLVDGLLRWIDEDRSKPFYSIAWTDQTHHPYTVSDVIPTVVFAEQGKLAAADKGRYLNAIRQADYHLGRLFAALRQRGLDKDTIVIVTGDHGEAFGTTHPVMGHGNGLFDENLRVPLVFWSPTLFAGGRRVDKPCGHVDINPTLAHLFGIKPPSDWQGCSLLCADHPGRAYVMSDRDGYQFGVIDGSYKALFYATGGYEQLFDLANDPLEQSEISGAHPDIAADLRARISAYIHHEEAYLKTVPSPRITPGGAPRHEAREE